MKRAYIAGFMSRACGYYEERRYDMITLFAVRVDGHMKAMVMTKR